jgi:hypothetical protein
MAHTLQDDLNGVIEALRNNSESVRLEAFQVLNESHGWTDEQYHACETRLTTLGSDFLRLIEKKRQLEREISRG